MKITCFLRALANSCVRETAPSGDGSPRPARPFVKKMQKTGTLLLAAAAVMTANLAPAARAQDTSGNFLMFHYNRARNGWTSVETLLTPTNVASGAFGEAWNSPQFASFNGNLPHLYAAPLYVSSVTLTGGNFAGQTMPVVYAGTTNGDVYAVCAQGAGAVPAGTILWTIHLGNPESSNDNNIPRGVFSTPCIDLNATPPTMYVACDVSGTGWEAFALDISKGTILTGWPVLMNDSTVAPVLQNGPAKFGASGAEAQRGGLNLSADGARLYVPFGDYSDNSNGYLIVINTNGTPGVLSAFAGCSSGAGTASQPYAGMWAAGGPALDPAGRIYVTTGNCPVPSPQSADQIPGYWGMSVLVFGPSTPLALVGTYSPWNYASMDVNDVDLCGSGVNVLPDVAGMNTHVISFGCKNGNYFLLDRDNLPGGTTVRPATNLISSQDPSLLAPNIFSYYTNGGATPAGAQGPLNVFGPYSEGSNNVGFAKGRTTPACFVAADGTTYVIATGATKTGLNTQNVMPPCVARLKINTSDSAMPYLTVDATEQTLLFESPSSPIVTSNGSKNAIEWNMDANVFRGDNLVPSHPYLVGVDLSTMTTIFKSAVGSLHAGGKYNEPSSADGLVFAGTDRIQAFGVLSNQIAIAAGSNTGSGIYVADMDFTGGQVNTGSFSPDSSGVTNPAPAAVYQNCRTSASQFSYNISGLAAGASYSVRLHFCDPTSTATGQRKFNVSINNTQVLTNYDIFAVEGTLAAAHRAVAEPFDAVADSGGNINIVFAPGTAGAPIVSAIQVSTIAGTFSNITITSPIANSDNPSPLPFGFFLPQAAASGTLQLTLDNGMQQFVLTFADNLGRPGQHNILIDTTNPTNNPQIVNGPASIPDGIYTLTLAFQDTSGDPVTDSQPVTGVTIDAQPPTITPPAGGFTPTTIVTAAGSTTAPLPDYTGQVTANDDIGVVSITQSPAAGTVEPEGTVQVTVTAFDGAGNSASTQPFAVNIIDGRVLLTKPTVGSANSSPLTVNYSLPQAGATGQTVLKFVDSSNNEFDLVLDDAGGFTTQGTHSLSINTTNPTSSAGIASGPMIPDGTYTITLTSADQLGDGPQSSPPVTGVIIDATLPTISAPDGGFSPTTLLTIQNQNTASVPDYTVQAVVHDNISVQSVRQVPAAGSSANLDTVANPFTPVVVTVTDEAGNTASLTVQLHVKSSQTSYPTVSASGNAVPGAGSDTDIPAGSIFTGYGFPSSNDSAVVAYSATWTSPNPAGKGSLVKGSGIFVGNKKIVTLLSPVPGILGQSWLSFTDPVLDANGHVAFLATIGGKKIKTTTVAVTNGINGTLQIVAQTGTASPSPEGANYKSFAAYSLRPGQLTLLATLATGSGSPKVKSTDAIGVFQYTSGGGSQVLRQGETIALAGITEGLSKFSLFNSVVGSPGQGRDEDAAGANLTYVGTFPKNVQAVIKGTTVIAQSGTTDKLDPNTTPTGATWAKFGPVAVNDAGTGIAFQATLTKGAGGITPKTAAGIFLSENGGNFQLIAQENSADAPGIPGAKFVKFLDPVMAADTTGIAFIATVKGDGVTSANNTGVWWKPTGQPLQLVAQAGGHPPTTPIGAAWKSFSSLALPGGGMGPVFVANLAAGKGGINGTTNSGIWGINTAGTMQELVLKGEAGAEGGNPTVTAFTALAAEKNSPGVTRNFNNAAGFVLRVTFSTGLTAVLQLGIP